MSWVSLTADVPEAASELAQSLMYDFNAAGLELRDGGHQVMPNVRPPARGEAIIIAFFSERRDATAAKQELARRVPGARLLIEDVVERDWSTEWRQQIKSVQVGRLWVGPPWELERAPADKVRIVIEPKMAFGTGDHPTTSLCLAAVDAFMAANPKADVLDVGTGTGVLAFAARKLGAARVVGLDNDEHSVELAREAATENGLADGLLLSTDTLAQVRGSFDLVVANILANTLVELAPAIAPKVRRRLVLAGVLAPQADQVSAAFEALGLTPAGRESIGEWVRLDFTGPTSPTKAPRRTPTKKKTRTRSPTRARAERKLSAGRKPRK